MCICLNKKTFKVCHCIPLWAFVLGIALLTVCENVLILAGEWIYIVPSVIMTLLFILTPCSCRSLNLRNCIWVTYLILGLIQLMVSLVVFGILIVFPEEEECT